MPLSDDQRAMLRLLAQREQGYDDIAALLGLSVDEVRAKVKEALAQLEDEGVAPPPLPAEPPVPISAAAAEPAPASVEPAAPDPSVAREPEPTPPAKPIEETKPPAPAPSKRPPSKPPKLSLPAGDGPRAAIAAGIAVVILVVVVLIVSGNDPPTTSPSSRPAAESSNETQNTAAPNTKEVTKAILNPVGGGSATGVAIFGRVKNSLALQIEAEGLEPLSQGQSYTIWLAQSPQRMLPLASTPLNKKGGIGAQFEVPTEVLAYLAKGTFEQIVVTRTADAALKAALAKATKEERAPAYTGTEVLRGTITGPIVGAANKKTSE